MKFFASMKKKGEKIIKDAEALEVKANEMISMLEEMPQSNKAWILKIWPIEKWDEEYVNRRFTEFTKLVEDTKEGTLIFNTQYKDLINSNAELKARVVAADKVNLNDTRFHKTHVENLKAVVDQYNKDVEARKVKEEKEKQVASIYANAVKIADVDKIKGFEVFANEHEAKRFFKDNYKDYSDVHVDGDYFGYKDCYFYIADVLVEVEFEYEIDKTNDINDRDYYSAGDLSKYEFKLADQTKLLQSMEDEKQKEILALEAKLKQLKGA